MPAVVAGIHVLIHSKKTWMAGTSPAMTSGWWRHELLAGEIGTIQLVVGPAGRQRCQGRGLDRRAQLYCAAKPGEDEKRGPRLLLSLQRGQGDRRHRGNHPRGLSRPD